MKLPVAMAGLAMIALPLAACSEQAQQESSEAADAIGDDLEATGENAWQVSQEAVEEAGETADRIGRDISEGADAAADATGSALSNAGRALDD